MVGDFTPIFDGITVQSLWIITSCKDEGIKIEIELPCYQVGFGEPCISEDRLGLYPQIRILELGLRH